MAVTNGKYLGLTYGWASGASGWGSPVNTNFAKLDVMASGIVSSIIAAPSGSEADGASYIVSSSPSGAFAGKAGNIAIKYAGGWIFVAPTAGMLMSTSSDGKVFQYKNSTWTEFQSGGPAPEINDMTGATASTAGTHGLVPAPPAGSQNKVLSGAATWVDLPVIPTPPTIPNPDTKTIRLNTGKYQVIDVAIGGNEADLASARGQVGGSPSISTLSNLNDYTKQGNYFFFNAAIGENFPSTIGGWLSVLDRSNYIYQIYRIINSDRVWQRRRDSSNNWYPWQSFVNSALLGDNLAINNGVLSVREYQGATASAAGIAGVVPPATTQEVNKFLRGDGEWIDPATGGNTPTMVGATDSAAGSGGSVPAPVAGDNKKFLSGAGTWSPVPDIAIKGDMADLASTRGQIGDILAIVSSPDYNTLIKAGEYRCGASNVLNGPPIANSQFMLKVMVSNISNGQVGVQIAYRLASSINATSVWVRSFSKSPNVDAVFSDWQVRGAMYGDGILVNGATISVPQYQGATASANAVSGLVPPALIADKDKVLKGDGTWAEMSAGGGGVVDTGNKVTLSGDATGEGAFNAAGDATIPVAIANMTGASASAAGAKGLVPPPAAGDQGKVLSGAGTWIEMTSGGGIVDQGSTVTLTGDAKGTAAFGADGNVSIATTIDNYTGATASANGTKGLVPPALIADKDKVLKGDGTWYDVDAAIDAKINAALSGINTVLATLTNPEVV